MKMTYGIQKKVVVVGAGLGGLSAACVLAKKGYEVEVIEQNAQVGGKAREMYIQTNLGTFRFDMGPSLLTLLPIFKQLFEECDENMHDYLDFYEPESICKYFWSDGTNFTYYKNQSKLLEEFVKTGIGEYKYYRNYQQYVRRLWEVTKDYFLFRRPSYTLLKEWKFWKSLPGVFKLDFGRSMHQANRQELLSPKLIQIFDRYGTYNGSNPYKMPATFNLISYVESLGAFLPKRGIHAVPASLYRLAQKLGVKFRLNTKASRIMLTQAHLDEGKSANLLAHSLICTNKDESDETIFFDAVISNFDPTLTYQHLLPGSYWKSEFISKRMQGQLSSSAVVFYWCVKGEFEQLDLHNILFAENYQEEFDYIFKRKDVYFDPTIYIHITKKQIATDAPMGCENWFVLINMPSDSGIDWEEEITDLKNTVIDKIQNYLKIDNLHKLILEEKVMTPDELRDQTGAWGGSLYGLNSNTPGSAFLRPKYKSREIDGLYFAGGTVHPGGGMPLAVQSGRFCAQQVIEDLEKDT